jgi:hypothetical protein
MPSCPSLTDNGLWLLFQLSFVSHQHTPSVINTIVYVNHQLRCFNLTVAVVLDLFNINLGNKRTVRDQWQSHFIVSGHRILYLNKYSPFLDFRGHRIRYLLIFNENILFLHEIADSESANVLKSALFTQLTEPLSANEINPNLKSYKSLDY